MEWEYFPTSKEKPDLEAEQFRKSQDFAFFAVQFGYSKADYNALTETERALILKAYEKGCIYDAWGEYFKYQTGVDCFQECNVDMDFYTTRTRSDEEVFPWDFLDCGVNRAFLLREWKRAAEAVVTPNCKMQCQGCGAARFGGGICFEQRGGDAV